MSGIVRLADAGIVLHPDTIRTPTTPHGEVEELLSRVLDSRPNQIVVLTMDADGEVTIWAEGVPAATTNWMLDSGKAFLFWPQDEE